MHYMQLDGQRLLINEILVYQHLSFFLCFFHRKQVIPSIKHLPKCTPVLTAIAPSREWITSGSMSKVIWVSNSTHHFKMPSYNLMTTVMRHSPISGKLQEFSLFMQVTSPSSAHCVTRSFWRATCWRNTWKSTWVRGDTSVASAASCTELSDTSASTWGPTRTKGPTSAPGATRATRPRSVCR